MTDHDFHYLAQEVEAPASKGGEVDALREGAGWIIGNNGGQWRTFDSSGWTWTDRRDLAVRYARRQDAEVVHGEDEDAWCVEQYPAALLTDVDEFETVEAWEHDDQRELSLLYNHAAHDRPQFNRGQMRTAIRHAKALARAALLTPTESAAERALDYERAYFERGMLAAYAWVVTKPDGESLSDAIIDHAWVHRDEGIDADDVLPIRAASPTTPSASGAGAGSLVAGSVWREDEEEGEVWTAEVQTLGGYSVMATVHGGSRVEAVARQAAVIEALATPRAEQTGDGI